MLANFLSTLAQVLTNWLEEEVVNIVEKLGPQSKELWQPLQDDYDQSY